MSDILVVDDDPEIRSSFVEILQTADMQVDTVADADEAANKIKAKNYELILVDLLLPGEINGMSLIESFRALVAQSYIIAYSAYSGRTIAEKALRAGANGFVPKAYLKDHLLQTVMNVLTGPKGKTILPGPAAAAPEPSPAPAPAPAPAPFLETRPAQDVVPLLFLNLPRQQVQELLTLADQRTLPRGDSFLVQSQQNIVTIGRGQADLLYRNRKIGQMNEGETIGEASFFDTSNDNHVFALVAKNDCVLYLFNKSDLKNYFKDHGRNVTLRFAANIVWSVSNTMMKCVKELYRTDEVPVKSESLFENRKPWSAEVLVN